MNRTQMLDLLDKGYTPEYISLMKWLELRRQVMMGELIDRNDIGTRTCALCNKYYFFNCDSCTITKHFTMCERYYPKSVWKQINDYVLNEKPVPLSLITQMVNQLQFLVAVYGKYVTNRNKP